MNLFKRSICAIDNLDSEVVTGIIGVSLLLFVFAFLVTCNFWIALIAALFTPVVVAIVVAVLHIFGAISDLLGKYWRKVVNWARQ